MMLEFLYQAATSQYGIVLHAVPVDTVRQKLYRARAEAGDPELGHLQIRISPVRPEEEIWIVKGSIQKDNAEP